METVEQQILLNNSTGIFTAEATPIKYALVNLVPLWSRCVLTLYLMVVIFLGLPANTLIILVQMKNQSKSATDWFMVFLATSDLTSLLVCALTVILICMGWWERVGTSLWCTLHMYTLQIVYISSTFLIMFVSVDRYSRLMVNKKRFTPNRAFYTGVLTYIISGVWNIPALLTTKNNILGQCIIDPDTHSILLFSHALGSILTISSSILLTYIYIKIILQVRTSLRIQPLQSNQTGTTSRSQANIPTNHVTVPNKGTSNRHLVHITAANHTLVVNHVTRQRSLTTTKVMGLLTFVFILFTSIPTIAGLALGALDMRYYDNGRVVIFFLTRLYFINNFTNPIFYLWLYPAFRSKVELLCSCCMRN